METGEMTLLPPHRPLLRPSSVCGQVYDSLQASAGRAPGTLCLVAKPKLVFGSLLRNRKNDSGLHRNRKMDRCLGRRRMERWMHRWMDACREWEESMRQAYG